MNILNDIDPKIKKEFERIKNCVIYIDWNIYSYLSGISPLTKKIHNKSMCFKHILFNELDTLRYCIPYSAYHYRDIMLGDPKYYKDKSSFLHSTTNSWKISEDRNDSNSVRIDKCLNKEDDFDIYKDNTNFSDTPLSLPRYTLQMITESHTFPDELFDLRKIILGIISDDSIPAGLSILRLNKKIKNTKIMYRDIEYKYPILPKGSLNSDNLKDVVNKAIKKSFIDFELIRSLTNKTLEMAKPFLSNFTNEVLYLGFLCEALGLCTEDLSKKTSFESQINDISHLSLGLRSHIFITEDKALKVKAEFIKKWHNLGVRIFDMNSFIHFVLKQKMTEIDSNRKPDSQIITFTMGDKNIGEFII